jgi:hypothetical protein
MNRGDPNGNDISHRPGIGPKIEAGRQLPLQRLRHGAQSEQGRQRRLLARDELLRPTDAEGLGLTHCYLNSCYGIEVPGRSGVAHARLAPAAGHFILFTSLFQHLLARNPMSPLHHPSQSHLPEEIDERKESGSAVIDDAVAHAAAENLRADDIAAVRKSTGPHSRHTLEHLSIDELRALANALDIKDRSQITEQDELIDEILKASGSKPK